jgi:hypothetical protein
VHPGVVESYMDGSMRKVLERASRIPSRQTSGLRPDEVAVVALLRSLSARGTKRAA